MSAQKIISVFCVLSISAVLAAKESLHKKSANPFFMHGECLTILQRQINEEMHASLVYLNMASHFDTLNVARKGFSKFFDESSKEEREHAKKIIDYVNNRGGTVDVLQVKMPTSNSWNSPLSALESALALEERVNNHLHQVHETANHVCDDAHLMDFIENEFLTEQVESIGQLRRLITTLTAMDSGMGEYLMDKELSGSKIEL